MKSFKKRILSGVLAVATMTSMVSAMGASATSPIRMSYYAGYWTADWDDFDINKANVSKTVKNGFISVTYDYHAESFDGGSECWCQTTTSSQARLSLDSGHRYQIVVVPTVKYKDSKGKTKWSMLGSYASVATMTTPSAAAQATVSVRVVPRTTKYNSFYETIFELHDNGHDVEAEITLASSIAKFEPNTALPDRLSYWEYKDTSIFTNKKPVGYIGTAKITGKDGSTRTIKLYA